MPRGSEGSPDEFPKKREMGLRDLSAKKKSDILSML